MLTRSGYSKVIAWATKQDDTNHIFVANLDVDLDQNNISIPEIENMMPYSLELAFSIPEIKEESQKNLQSNNYHFRMNKIEKGGIRIYKILKLK